MDARHVAGDQCAALAHVLRERLCHTRLDHDQRRRHDRAVLFERGQVHGAFHHIDWHVAPPERAVETVHLVRVMQALRGADTPFERPVALPVEHHGHLPVHARPHQYRRTPLQVGAELAHLTVGARLLGIVVADHRAMETLAAAYRLLELEELHGVGAVRHRLPREFGHFARLLDLAVREPVLLVRRLLHEHERLAAANATHQVVAHGGEARLGVHARVVVPAHHIHLAAPAVVVEVLEHAHQVRRDRRAHVVLANRVAFEAEAVEHLLVLEASVVDLQARDHAFVGADRVAVGDGRHNLVPIVDRVAPEVHAPRAVELLDRPVLAFEPAAERLRAQVAVAVAAAVAVLVVHMPRLEARRAGVTLGHARGERAGEAPEVGRGGAEIVPPAEHLMRAVDARAHDLRVVARHPRGDCGGAGGQHDREPVAHEQVDDPVEHRKVVRLLVRLEQRPREHVDRRLVDVRVFEKPDVVLPRVFGPLFGVPVAAEHESVEHRHGRSLRVRVAGQAAKGSVPGRASTGSAW